MYVDLFIASELYFYSAAIDTLVLDSKLVQKLKSFIISEKESIHSSTPLLVYFSHLQQQHQQKSYYNNNKVNNISLLKRKLL